MPADPNPIIQLSNEIFRGPIILLVLLFVPALWSISKGTQQKVADEHNESQKNHPRFRPVLEEDVNRWAGCQTTIIAILLMAFAIFMIVTQKAIDNGN